jgi:hypothetical protein
VTGSKRRGKRRAPASSAAGAVPSPWRKERRQPAPAPGRISRKAVNLAAAQSGTAVTVRYLILMVAGYLLPVLAAALLALITYH